MNKLLIVDDEQIERAALQYIVEQQCSQISQIETAVNGREAIKIATEMQSDIILMDIKMPGMSGLEAAQSIKNALPDCKIIFLTAFDYFDYAQQAIRIGADEFILKPVSDEIIVGVIDRMVRELEEARAIRDQDKLMSDKLNMAIKSLENEWITTLIEGELEKLQQDEYLSILNIKSMDGYVVSMNIQYYLFTSDASTSVRRQLMKIRSMEKIKQLFEHQQFQCLTYELKESIYFFIFVHEPDGIEKRINDVFQHILVIIKNELHIGISLGISEMFHSIEQLSRSFQQAKLISKRSTQIDRVVHYRNMEQTLLQHSKYPIEKEKQLSEQMVRCNEKEAYVLLEDILDWMTQSFDSLELLKTQLYEFVIVLHRSTFQELKGMNHTNVDYYGKLQTADRVEAARKAVKHIVADMLEEIGLLKLDNDRTGALIEKVCDYMKEHYMKDITLDDMAKLINYSTYYFSRMFKYYQKKNFVDYLTHIRIMKAKELMLDPALAIKEISSLVGFHDSNYFTRVFKRSEGITPTEYRDKKML